MTSSSLGKNTLSSTCPGCANTLSPFGHQNMVFTQKSNKFKRNIKIRINYIIIPTIIYRVKMGWNNYLDNTTNNSGASEGVESTSGV
jgi:hypothetical protein